mmetsp:Transcript_7483/g.22150  ORF Transcript_7483/g.22150 Transcript_7483/m.22150 type:complete len:223 (+) Transcript_7483:100-768(+)
MSRPRRAGTSSAWEARWAPPSFTSPKSSPCSPDTSSPTRAPTTWTSPKWAPSPLCGCPPAAPATPGIGPTTACRSKSACGSTSKGGAGVELSLCRWVTLGCAWRVLTGPTLSCLSTSRCRALPAWWSWAPPIAPRRTVSTTGASTSRFGFNRQAAARCKRGTPAHCRGRRWSRVRACHMRGMSPTTHVSCAANWTELTAQPCGNLPPTPMLLTRSRRIRLSS